MNAPSASERGEGDESKGPRIGTASSAVINGQADTTHQAVVAIMLQEGNNGGICSGTIVKVDPQSHIGWVATAAHCVEIPPVLVLQGNDIESDEVLRYDVVDYQADSRYSGQTSSPYDFAVIRIAGVDASTPTIPLASSPDGIASGTSVVSVGYGRTTLGRSGEEDMNSVRRRVSKTLSQVNSQLMGYDMRDNGICQGDSGGPVLATTSGGERVVGIHSYVEGDCDGFGVSGRVSGGASFFATQLAKAAPAEDCALCEKVANSGNSQCAVASRKCLADKQCAGYYECLANGSSKATCLGKFPKAEGPFNVAANCTCTQACASSCGSSLECRGAPKCGYKISAGNCKTCTESSCCDETLACAADGDCYLCLKTNDAAPECATNAARKKMATCVASKCTEDCAGSGLENGADPLPEPEPEAEVPNAAAPGTTTTTTTTSCAFAPRDAGRNSGHAAFALALATVATAFARSRRRR